MEDILDQLGCGGDACVLKFGGTKLHVSNLDRRLWPDVTKRDLLTYYVKVASVALPHLENRPLGFVQYPKGLAGPRKFERHYWPDRTPPWIHRVEIYSVDKGVPTVHLMIDDLQSLLWFAQISVFELHPWYSRADKDQDFSTSEEALESSVLNYPDWLVIDLDPNVKSPDESWKLCLDAASVVKELLDGLKLKSWVKTSGKAGLHIFVPIKRIYNYDTVRAMAEAIGRTAVAAAPDVLTLESRTARRPAKVYFDFHQNVRAKTLVAPYSPRETEFATVSMPIDWGSLGSVHPEDFRIQNVPDIVAARGDPWRGILNVSQEIG